MKANNSKGHYPNVAALREKIAAARGDASSDIVVKGAQFLDVFSGSFVAGDVAIHGTHIVGISDQYEGRTTVDGQGTFLVPGFIDAHVHIESSMMTPVRFQEAALPCGTTAIVWDPHEIANVWGKDGIRWALSASENLHLDVFVMVPSCVPSTTPAMNLETSGADLRARDIEEFRSHPRVLGLAEMMNFPGLLFGDEDVLTKLSDYRTMKRDGHCPGLSGKDLNAYATAGIHSCHESTTLSEAKEKLMKGIHVLIREGSCAKDAHTLVPLLNAYTSATLAVCSDDRNPLDIQDEGHLNFALCLALKMGIAPEVIFRAASFAAARMYGLEDRGAIAPGYLADMVQVRPTGGDWKNGFEVCQVWKSGVRIDRAELIRTSETRQDDVLKMKRATETNIRSQPVDAKKLQVVATGNSVLANVIGVRPGQIVTDHLKLHLSVKGGFVQANVQEDVLKIAVIERHHRSGRMGVGFVRGFGLKAGAIATTVNHDSHNIIVVGANDEDMLTALQDLLKMDGGICVHDGTGRSAGLPLPVAGLMSTESPNFVAVKLKEMKTILKSVGCTLSEPFLSLSFLALPVIPNLKITDRGLVDATSFKVISVVSEG
jgi:adenine deaminase